ncbi:hypothetical protein GCM10027290_51930 [Micromonospora sonneratiae]
MNLKEWAAVTGVSYVTVRRRYESGTLPVPRYQLARLIMVGDRFARFGAECVKAALTAQGRRLLVDDVTEILTSLCARLYGCRAAVNCARRAVEAATEGPV